MGRQALRDAVVRYNAEGLDGLHDRLRPSRSPRLSEAERPALSKLILDGPDVEASGLSCCRFGGSARRIAGRGVVG